MKETTRTVQVKAYTDEDGNPVCGCCWANSGTEWCEHANLERLQPGPSCPVWNGEKKSDTELLIEEISNNKETFVSAGQTPQMDADEPRYAVHITGPERLLSKLVDLICGSQHENSHE